MTVRVTTLKGADADAYYVEQLPNYYLDSGEPRGVWFGHGAHTLGLTGEVDDDAFLAVMAGMRPDNPNKCRRDHCCTVPPAHEPHVGPATAYARGDPEPCHVTRQTVARFGRPPDQAKSANVVGAAPRDVARGVDGEPRCAVGGAKGGIAEIAEIPEGLRAEFVKRVLRRISATATCRGAWLDCSLAAIVWVRVRFSGVARYANRKAPYCGGGSRRA